MVLPFSQCEAHAVKPVQVPSDAEYSGIIQVLVESGCAGKRMSNAHGSITIQSLKGS